MEHTSYRDSAASKEGEKGLGDKSYWVCYFAIFGALYAEKAHELSWREKRCFRRIVRNVNSLGARVYTVILL